MPTSTELVQTPALFGGASFSTGANDARSLYRDSRPTAGTQWEPHTAPGRDLSSPRYKLLRYSRLLPSRQFRTSGEQTPERVDGRGTMLEPVRDGLQIPVATASDIVAARQEGRDLALRLGFSPTESTLVATAISELGRNIVLYAKSGAIRLEPTHDGDRMGIAIVARDKGPGIRDVQRALLGGYSTSEGLGLGLSGVRRIMDELAVDSGAGKGTTVIARKWRDLRR